MQTILGSGGAIGFELAKALKNYTHSIRLVSRKPEKVNQEDELFPADLTRQEEVNKAVAGSEVVYLVVGFEYKVKIWQKNWPALMRNVINACKEHQSKLVFFDNVYMYDINSIPHMTEEAPINPPSRKGAVRAEISRMLMQEVESRKLEALIARAADFIGPKNSLLSEMVIKKLMKGKKADWFASVDKIHSFTFTPDAAKGTALLGNTSEAYGEVWHLPTTHERLTIKNWIELIGRELDKKPKYRLMSKGMMGLMGVFVSILREFKEMVYQYDRDYFFDSSKFEKRFGFQPAKPEEAVRETLGKL